MVVVVLGFAWLLDFRVGRVFSGLWVLGFSCVVGVPWVVFGLGFLRCCVWWFGIWLGVFLSCGVGII